MPLNSDVPSPPLGPLNVSAMTEASMTISWYPPENNGGTEIIEYVVEIKQLNKKTWKSVGSSKTTSLFIDNLKKGTSYVFKIIACNEVGQSSPYIVDDHITVGVTLCKFLWYSF